MNNPRTPNEDNLSNEQIARNKAAALKKQTDEKAAADLAEKNRVNR